MNVACVTEYPPLIVSFKTKVDGGKSLLGGKGEGLNIMTRAGLPVPPGFTITVECCKYYWKNENKLWPEMIAAILRYMVEVGEDTGKEFGNKDNPLLVSVRSGAAVSMPGMMETVLNLGLNDETVEGLANQTKDRRFAYDCYRRFIQMFSTVVFGINATKFSVILERVKAIKNLIFDYEILAEDLEAMIVEYKSIVKEQTGNDFPQDVNDQLTLAVEAVFQSWNCDNAIEYRNAEGIPHDLGTAVNIQSMVFGNSGANSGTGVAFTRNPANGKKMLYGEFLVNAQGEDVVAGTRTPLPISELKEKFPNVFNQLMETFNALENYYRDMQDIEFTVENDKLYMLQTRTAKRTAPAAVQCVVDMVNEGLITVEEALLRVTPTQVDWLLHPQIDPKEKVTPIAKGLNASPGAACGKAVFDSEKAIALAISGEKVLLVRPETNTDDIGGIIKSQGILTSRGGLTSHAAVVTRGMGKPCVCGCESIKVDVVGRQFSVGDTTVKEGDIITIDGNNGNVIIGEVKMIESTMTPELETLLKWADDVSMLKVRANADTPEDTAKARYFGATGIGLCRTEHMFMSDYRKPIVQEMILAETIEERYCALGKLLPMQREDFIGILEAMSPYPVTIRLLDPPLHEFLPERDKLIQEIAELEPDAATAKKATLKKVDSLHEVNPMLGHRGCRLGLTNPEIYRMQTRAIFEAMYELNARNITTDVEIEVPLVMNVKELSNLKSIINTVYEEILAENDEQLEWRIGTMLELPRACLIADKLAQEAEFFSFGTNDLTQTTLGISRDDAEREFIPAYIGMEVIDDNPFAVLDREGVGELMEIAVSRARKERPGILMGICGEHGGEPSSIEYCHIIGLDYVSCSTFRVPPARLAAAQAALNCENVKYLSKA